MLIDITLPITRQMWEDAANMHDEALVGHLGTHFDAMDKPFPLDYTKRRGVAFDVHHVTDREIDLADVDLTLVDRDTFVAFYTGYSKVRAYGERGYFSEHPQLSYPLIDALLEKGISIIGVDFAGIRRGKEHIPIDQRCADRGVFVIENLYGVDDVLRMGGRFTAHTYPLPCVGMTGLPCRVIAEI